MSEQAAKNFADSEERRLGQNDARRIMGERDKARSPSGDAARRWPFELLQNAHDPGPRDGETFVKVDVSHSDSLLTFRHDGRPFSSDDLAALVSGGSNKDYDSAETTGRYGTGFLVTHVLSAQIALAGNVDVPPHLERFRICLDRSGDANAILSNAKAARRDIAAATRIEECNAQWTAEFSFPLDNGTAAEDGLELLGRSAPFLFGTCEHLGRLTIANGGGLPETWECGEARPRSCRNGQVLERTLVFKRDGTSTKYRILRFSSDVAPDVGALVLLRLEGDEWQFVIPNADLPRVFTRLPIRGATFLPTNVIVDGKFNALQERDRIAMDESDCEKLSIALRLIPPIMEIAMDEDWRGCHWMCRMAKVQKGFSDNETEIEFWNQELKGVAQCLATLPLVKTEDEYLPVASDNGRYADFILPRYSRTSPCDEVDVLPVWKLAEQATVLDPAVAELACDWNEISGGWETLEISVARRGLKEIAEEVSEAAEKLPDLPVKGDPIRWLAQFLDALGQLPAGHDCAVIIDGLLPNQCGDLSPIASLSFDAGIPEELKDLAEAVGHTVRDGVLDANLAALGADDGYPFLQELLHRHITNRSTEEMVLKECIDYVSSQLPDSENADQGGQLEQGSVSLLRYIWKCHGVNGAMFAHKCPLLTRANLIARHSAKKIMAPVAAWHETAQLFAEIYVPGRVLADLYCDESDEGQDLVEALVEWGIAYPDPLVRGQRKEIDEKLLREMVTGPADVQGVKVRDVEFSRVALLETEVIQHCEDDPELASLLLGFVLLYLAPHDNAWRTTRPIIGKRGTEDVPLEVHDAIWLADLKSRSWIPCHQAGTDDSKLRPVKSVIAPMLKEEWLTGNDSAIDLLIRFFHFDVLDLRLKALPEEIKAAVSERLATLVEMGGDNPDFYQRVVADAVNQALRQKEKERNRQFGLAVQDAITGYLRKRKLNVTVVDRGYDLDVNVPEGTPLVDAGSHQFDVGPYHVEVKATTTGEAQLTPAQAQTASKDDRFVLCVVDLRQCPPERLCEPWAANDVRSLTRMVTGLRAMVTGTRLLVEAAAGEKIAIRNAGKLRYAVPPRIWEQGIPVATWVDQVASHLT